MKKYLYIVFSFAVLLLSSSTMISCGGGGVIDDNYNNYIITDENIIDSINKKPEILSINISYCTFDTWNYNFVMFSVPVEEIVGGRAELTATPVDSNAAVAKIIIGTYDSGQSSYIFNVDELIDNQAYIFRVKVYDQKGNVVIESDEVEKKMPDSSKNSSVDGDDTSDGTRTW